MTVRVVIGVGNEYRSDDGVGPALVAALQRQAPPGVRLALSDGEPAGLMEEWAGAPLAVVVDAVLCDPPAPGTIHRTELVTSAGALRPGAASSHSLGIPDALRLGRALDRVPHRLVVYAVEAETVAFGTELSAAVAAALPELVDAVLAELSAGLSAP